MQILGAHQHIDARPDAAWLLSAQHPIGGFGKVPGEPPDLLHSYLGLAAVAMHVHDEGQRSEAGWGDMGVKELGRLDPAMNCTRETREWLRETLRVDGE